MGDGRRVFVDSGAWVALALTRDPHHLSARETWNDLLDTGARLYTSVPVVLETFTFLDRNTRTEVALAWKDALASIPRLVLLECRPADLESAWEYFSRRDLHKLSAVDATSFVLMRREEIRVAFTPDHHFAQAGFRVVA